MAVSTLSMSNPGQAGFEKRNRAVLALMALAMTGVFLLDVLTPLGYAKWVLYVVVIALAYFQSWPWAPPIAAAVAGTLLIAGFWLSPPGIDRGMDLVNRGVGLITVCGVAFLLWKVLRDRLHIALLRWRDESLARLAEVLRGDHAAEILAGRALDTLAEATGAPVGAVYLAEADGSLMLAGRRAASLHAPPPRIAPGLTLLGQAVSQAQVENRIDLPADYIRIESSLGHAGARGVLLVPIVHEGEVYGAIELARPAAFDEVHRDLAERAVEPIAIMLGMARARGRNMELLAQAQSLNEELRTQQEELRTLNDELEERNRRLQASEEELRVQSEELKTLNEALEEKSRLLERQKVEVEDKNRTLKLIAEDLDEKARALERSSRYKSEFLANMSRELRTPLNSMLLLSGSLLANDEGNLSDDQLESARIIHKGGQDLLALINDILDLSKIEAGKLVFHREPVAVRALLEGMVSQLAPLARSKGLSLQLEAAEDAPAEIISDAQRIDQILKNLLSNALKFTQEGVVTLRVAGLDAPMALRQGILESGITNAVTDTGIGIAPERRHDIWEAFQQADGSTSRNFGGTGLGLTISRQLAWHLGVTCCWRAPLGGARPSHWSCL
jgi:signal transduction histidine kinase